MSSQSTSAKTKKIGQKRWIALDSDEFDELLGNYESDIEPFSELEDEEDDIFSAESQSSDEEIDFFSAAFPRSLVEHIVTETNKYYKYLCANVEVQAKSKMYKWKDTTCEEMYVFLAMFMFMGHKIKHEIEMYWSTDKLISTPIFFWANVSR